MSNNTVTIVAGKYPTINAAMTANGITLECAGVAPALSNKEDRGVDDSGNVVKYGRQYASFDLNFYPFYAWERTNDIQQSGQLLTTLRSFKAQKYVWITDVGTDFLDFWQFINESVTYTQTAITDYITEWYPNSITVASNVCTVTLQTGDGMPFTTGQQIIPDTSCPGLSGNYYTIATIDDKAGEDPPEESSFTFAVTAIDHNDTVGTIRGMVNLEVAAHGLTTGDSVFISDCVSSNDETYNGSFSCIVLDTDNFTIPVTIDSSGHTTITTLGNLNTPDTTSSGLNLPILVDMEDWQATDEYPTGSKKLVLPLIMRRPYTPTEIG